jgi:hypothetical protein
MKRSCESKCASMKTVSSEGSVRMLKGAASAVKIDPPSNHLNASAMRGGVRITVAVHERRNRGFDAPSCHSVVNVLWITRARAMSQFCVDGTNIDASVVLSRCRQVPTGHGYGSLKNCWRVHNPSCGLWRALACGVKYGSAPVRNQPYTPPTNTKLHQHLFSLPLVAGLRVVSR